MDFKRYYCSHNLTEFPPDTAKLHFPLEKFPNQSIYIYCISQLRADNGFPFVIL
jgi:hypothetical protein